MTDPATLLGDLQKPWRHGEHVDARGLVLADALVLDGMTLRGVDLSNAHLKSGLSARNATFLGLAWLRDTRVDGLCDLTGAQFRIDLRAEGLVTDSLLLEAIEVRGVLALARVRARSIALADALVMANLTLEDADVAGHLDLSRAEIMGGFWADGANLATLNATGTEVFGRLRNGSTGPIL